MTATPLAGAAEASVVALAISGDHRAFTELVRRRQGTVRELMRRLCGDRAFAEDLAQQAFVQAWRQLGRLRSPGAFGGWLRSIAVNVWLQEVRRAPARLESSEADLPEPEAEGPEPAALAAARLDLSRALLRLKAPERVCVVLAYAEGLSHGEIADATGWPLGTVKSNVARGAERLRAWLSPQGESMNEEFDPGLRRLFAATAEHPADETFAAQVTTKVNRARRLRGAGRALALAVLAAAALVTAATVGPVLGQEAGVIGGLVNGSLCGSAAGVALVLAGLVLVRLFALLSRSRT